MKKHLKLNLILSGWLMVAASTYAETRTVKGVGVQFKPEIVFADQGDDIEFREMPTHFVDTIKIPDGAEKMLSDMGANYGYKIEQPGVYFYKCPPHWGARMGGLILVGVGLQDEEKLIESLTEYREAIDDKTAKGYLKKVIKKIKKGKIKLPE